MNGRHLNKILMAAPLTRSRMLGIFPQNILPEYKIPGPGVLIVNTDNHWCAIYLNVSGLSEYFDPLGRPPPFHVKSFFKHQKCNYIYNTTQIQGPYSMSCGHFCIFYVALNCTGLNMSDIVNMFSKSYANNDAIVLNFVEALTYK